MPGIKQCAVSSVSWLTGSPYGSTCVHVLFVDAVAYAAAGEESHNGLAVLVSTVGTQAEYTDAVTGLAGNVRQKSGNPPIAFDFLTQPGLFRRNSLNELGERNANGNRYDELPTAVDHVCESTEQLQRL